MDDATAEFLAWYDSPDGKTKWIADAESVKGFLTRAYAAGRAAGYAVRKTEQFRAAYSANTQPPVAAPGQMQQLMPLPTPVDWSQHPRFDRYASVPQPYVSGEPDPFAQVRLTGPQQAAMDSLYPLPDGNEARWDRVEAALTPEKRPEQALPGGFELAEGYDPRNLPVYGPVDPV